MLWCKHPMGIAALTFACLLLVTTTTGQQQDTGRAHGSIHGFAVRSDGQPAKRTGLTAIPLGVALGTILPHATTDDLGHYRFDLPWWGKYTVYADDENAGYSSYSTGQYGQSQPPTLEITDGHPEGEMTVILPPRAAFFRVNLTNRITGRPISAMRISVLSPSDPSLAFDMSCYSTKTVLMAPDKALSIHITSDGFREWNESVGRGKMLHLGSGEHLELNVALDPGN